MRAVELHTMTMKGLEMIGRILHWAWVAFITLFVLNVIGRTIYGAYTERDFHNGFWLGCYVGAAVVIILWIFRED